jgi:hypothetical protein
MDNTHKKEDNEVEGICNCGSIRVRFPSGLTPDLLLCYWYYSQYLLLSILSILTTSANISDNCRRSSGGSAYSRSIQCYQSMPVVAKNIDNAVGSTNFTVSESHVTIHDPTESLRVYYDKNTSSGRTILVIFFPPKIHMYKSRSRLIVTFNAEEILRNMR